MLRTFYRHVVNLRCDSLLKLILLIVIAVPVAAIAQTRSNMSRDSSVNGYTLKRSTRDTEVRLVGVHQETRETSPLLNGKQQVVVTLDNGRTIKRMVTFKNGNAIFGRISNDKGRVMIICPCG
jgi:hypothetical protein